MSVRLLMHLLVKSISLCLTPCALRHMANCNDQINKKSICYVYLLMALLVIINALFWPPKPKFSSIIVPAEYSCPFRTKLVLE